jgi:hypothetical protein
MIAPAHLTALLALLFELPLLLQLLLLNLKRKKMNQLLTIRAKEDVQEGLKIAPEETKLGEEI